MRSSRLGALTVRASAQPGAAADRLRRQPSGRLLGDATRSLASRQPHLYGTVDGDIDRALTAQLRAHRDFIYETHLQLPIVF